VRDHVAEVFGDDEKRSYCRAISSTCSVKHVKLMQASKAIFNYRENANQQWRIEMQNSQKEMQNSHNQMCEEMKTMSLAISDMRQCIKLLVDQIGGNVTTPRPEDASNTEQNLNSPVPNKSALLDKVTLTSTREKQSVKLLAPDLTKVVAKGHLGTQKICHGRKVVEGEQVVWVEEVLDPEALLFDAPQNGHYTLSELVEGGFVIWPEYRLRYQ